MSLSLTGKIKSILPLETGEGKNGAWKKRQFVLEFTDGNYPKEVCMTMMGDKVSTLDSLTAGSPVTVFFNVSSREYNGRWYTDVQAWKIQAGQATTQPAEAATADEPSNDLPF